MYCKGAFQPLRIMSRNTKSIMSHGFSISLCHRENSDNRNYLKWTIQWTYCAKDSSYDKQKAVVSYDFQLQSHKSPGDIFDFRKFGLQFSRWVFFFPFSLSSSSFIWLILEKIYECMILFTFQARGNFTLDKVLDIALPRQFHHTPLSGAVDVLSVQRYVWRHSKT